MLPTLTQLPTGEDDDEHEKRILDEEKLKDFVGDFNKFFEDLAKWYKKDAEKRQNIKESFWEKYPEIFDDSSENKVQMNTTLKTQPPIDREEKLRKDEEKLLSKRTNERFTNYDGVMTDDSLSLPQKIIHLQKAIDDATRFFGLHCRENYLKNAFVSQRKFIKKLWRKQSLCDGGCYFYENYTSLLWTTI